MMKKLSSFGMIYLINPPIHIPGTYKMKKYIKSLQFTGNNGKGKYKTVVYISKTNAHTTKFNRYHLYSLMELGVLNKIRYKHRRNIRNDKAPLICIHVE
jgi:hypothetical protein